MKVALTATPSAAKFAPIAMRGDVGDAFRAAAELGYDGVELHLRQPGDVDRAALKRLMSDYGLLVPTIGTGMAAGEDGLTFSDPDASIRRQTIDLVKEQIELACELGSAVTIGLIRGRIGNDPASRDINWGRLLEGLEEVSEAAKRSGVTIFLEPLNRYECDNINTIEECLRVIRQVGPSNIRVLADTFHMNIEEVDIAASLRAAGAMLGYVHLVDSNRQVPGHGHLDMKSILLALKEANYEGYLSFEVLPIPSSRQAIVDAMAVVRESL